MARDFWRQGFELQRFTSFSSSTAVSSVLAILPKFWRHFGDGRREALFGARPNKRTRSVKTTQTWCHAGGSSRKRALNTVVSSRACSAASMSATMPWASVSARRR